MHFEYTPAELRAEKVIHGVGIGFALLAAALLAYAVHDAGAEVVAVAGVYALALIALPTGSAIYHMATEPVLKERARRFDHAGVFLMIAATYGPYVGLGLRGAGGARLLAFVWVVALVGMGLKLFRPRRYERVLLALYLALGGVGLLFWRDLVERLPTASLVLLVAGGAIYSGGLVFYAWRTLTFHNVIWHAFVLAAAVCQFFGVLAILQAAATP